jgi:5-methylcytosine-specific restriction endonuclease McrA
MYFSKKTKETIWLKYDKHCAYCGCDLELKKIHIDHIIPQVNYEWVIKTKIYLPSFLTHLTLSDMNSFDNLNPSCFECNNYKNGSDLEQFRSWFKKMINDEF